MSKATTGVCPYCGQTVIGGRDGAMDAREICGCYYANKYRKTIDALDTASEKAAPMKEIDPEVMDALREWAHLIGLSKVEKVTADLRDGTRVVISGKVSRSAKIVVEKKVG